MQFTGLHHVTVFPQLPLTWLQQGKFGLRHGRHASHCPGSRGDMVGESLGIVVVVGSSDGESEGNKLGIGEADGPGDGSSDGERLGFGEAVGSADGNSVAKVVGGGVAKTESMTTAAPVDLLSKNKQFLNDTFIGTLACMIGAPWTPLKVIPWISTSMGSSSDRSGGANPGGNAAANTNQD